MKIKNNTKKKNENGFSMVEIIFASAIISLSLIAIIQIAGRSIVFSRRSVNIYTASTLLEEGSEAVRIIRDNGWNNVSSMSTSTTYYPVFSTSTNVWSLSSIPSTAGIFTRTINFSSVNRDSNYDIASSGTYTTSTRLVTVSVSWKDGLGFVTKTISFYLNDIFS